MHVALAGPATPGELRDLVDLDAGRPLPVGLGGSPVNALGRALVEEGHRVTLATLSPDVRTVASFTGPSLSMICLPWRVRAAERGRDLFRVERMELGRALKHSGAAVVHSHWTSEYAWAALSTGLPSLVTVHDAPVTILRHHPDVYRLIRLAMAVRVRASGVAMSAVSPYAADRWRREMLDRRHVTVVPNIAPTVAAASTRIDDSSARHVVMI